MRAARKAFERFPSSAQLDIRRALTVAAEGRMSDTAKPMKGLGSGVFEIALRYRTNAYRVVYAVQIADAGGTVMSKRQTKDEDFELVHGSGNVFRDFGDPKADVEQLKGILAAQIIGILDDQKLSVRQAQQLTGVAASEFSRIRSAKYGRFTVDRMITILNKLDQEVEVEVHVRPRRPATEKQGPVLGV